MYCIIFLLLLGLPGSNPQAPRELGAGEPARSATPMFKGVELYSWKDCSGGEWYFSLLPGTNRNKTYREVTNPACTLKGTAGLKKELSRLAEGEQIFWFNTLDRSTVAGSPPLSFPPEDVRKDISDYCRPLRLYLHFPSSGNNFQQPAVRKWTP